VTADPTFVPFNVMTTPAVTLPVTDPEMVYVAAVLAVAVKFASVNDAEVMVSARLTGLKTCPVLLGDMVYFPGASFAKPKLPPVFVVLVLDDAPLSTTDTSLIPDTTPEMPKVELEPVLVLATVLEPVPVPVCAAVLPVIAVELPPHAARKMQASNAGAAKKRVDWIMNFP
jgi:hypothetical protein